MEAPGAVTSSGTLGEIPMPACLALPIHCWMAVTLLLLLFLQGPRVCPDPPPSIAIYFTSRAEGFFHFRVIFATVGIFFPQWHTVICSFPEEVRTRFATVFPGAEGCKPGGKSWWLKENRKKGFISVARTRPARWDPQAVSACFSGKVKALEIEIGLAEWGGRASGHSLEVCCGGRAKISYSLILHSRRFPAGRSHSFLPLGRVKGSSHAKMPQVASHAMMCHEVSWRVSHSNHSHLPPARHRPHCSHTCKGAIEEHQWALAPPAPPQIPLQSRTQLERSQLNACTPRQPQPEGLPLLAFLCHRGAAPHSPQHISGEILPLLTN